MEWNLRYIVVYLSVGIAVEAARSYRDCPPLRLRNGSVRLRPSGRMAKFKCNYPYKLVGNIYAQCTSGRWEVPMPICIKAGCKELPAIANGVHDITHDGSLVRFVCHYGFELEGPREIFCNGYNWNDTVPKCRGTKEVSKFGCNFDSSMCGWDDDELHDFNWRRKAVGPNITHLNWWPSSDHTNSSTGQGGYVYIERQSILTNYHSARLLSPSYHSDLTKNGCFIFYYYRSYPFQGSLKVYQKPDSIDMTTLTTAEQGQKYLRFTATASSYGQWDYGFFHLNETNEDFQIVIEGIANMFRASFLAVDDVTILQGQQCVINITAESRPILDFRYSCASRCGSRYPLLPLLLKLKICGCEESCLQTDTCCADFRDLCEFGTEDTTTDETTTETIPITQINPATTKKSPEITHIPIIYPSSRNLITQWMYRKPTSKQPAPTAYIPSSKYTTKTNFTRFINYKTTTSSKPSTIIKTMKPIPTSGKTSTEQPISTTTKKLIPTPTSSTKSKQASTALTNISPSSTVSTTANRTSISNFTSATRKIVSSTIIPRSYEADGKTAQGYQNNKEITEGQSVEHEKSGYSNRMHVTTICLAVFLCICGASILIMFIVKRRDRISSLITRLRIRHEYAKSSHVGKEGDVRFLIREDEVDLE